MSPHPHTERLYASLPELYRYADEAQDGRPLLGYLSLIGDQAGAVEDVIDSVDPDVGDNLTDPLEAPAAWLPWLAQVLGVALLPGMPEAEVRNALATAPSGRYAGSRQAIADAGRPALSDPEDGYLTVRPNYGGNPHTISVSVSPLDDTSAVLDAILRAGAKPAGYLIVVDTYSATWAQIETAYPTWGAIEAAGSWAAIEAAGI